MLGFKFCNFMYLLNISVVFILGFVNSSVLDDSLLVELYQSYIGAQDIGEGTVSARRVFTNNKNYEIHVMKLDEVNGKKRHNLLVKESNATNPLIYINNPVETKVPHAYLTYEEFKKELTDRVMALRQQFFANASKAVGRINLANKEMPVNKDREVKKFKIFLDRVNLQHKVKANPTKSKENNSATNATNVIKAKSPLFRVFTLKTDAESTVGKKIITTKKFTNKGTVAKSKPSTVKSDIKETTKAEIETSLESPTRADITEQSAEPEKIKQSLRENSNQSDVHKSDSSTTTITTTEEITTKKSTLGRPAVWLEGEEKPKDDALPISS